MRKRKKNTIDTIYLVCYLQCVVNATLKEGDCVNEKLLKSIMVLKGISLDALAMQIGISRSAFYRKKSGLSEFTRKEIQNISCILGLSNEQVHAIFFNHDVA